MFLRTHKPTAADRKIAALEKQVLNLQAEIEAKDRAIRVLEAERDSMAAVIARDRERVRSETAAFARATGDKS